MERRAFLHTLVGGGVIGGGSRMALQENPTGPGPLTTRLAGPATFFAVPYKDAGDFVAVKNIKEIIISGRKIQHKKYYHHSGYPGGLKEVSMKKVFEKNPPEVLRKAVLGMLPKNKLRQQQIKRLTFVQS